MSLFGGSSIDYIKVAKDDNKSTKPIEFALDKDKSLQLSKILKVYSDVTGLKYFNPKTNLDRIIDLDDENKKFLPPIDGWNGDYIYICTYKPKPKSNDTKSNKTFDKKSDKPLDEKSAKSFDKKSDKPLDKNSDKSFDKKSRKSFEKKSDKPLNEKSDKSFEKKSDKSFDKKSDKSFDKSSEKKFDKKFASDKNKSNFNQKNGDDDDIKNLPLINDLVIWYISNEIDKDLKTFLSDYGTMVRDHIIKNGFGLLLFLFDSKEKQKKLLSERSHMVLGKRYHIRLLKAEYVTKFCPVKLFVKTHPRILQMNDLYNYFTNVAVKEEFVHIYKVSDDKNFAFVTYMNGEIAKDLCKKKLPDYKNCQIFIEVAKPSNTNKNNENANSRNNSNKRNSGDQVNMNLTGAEFERYKQQQQSQQQKSPADLVQNVESVVGITSTILGWFKK